MLLSVLDFVVDVIEIIIVFHKSIFRHQITPWWVVFENTVAGRFQDGN
jgi:hypothetical protein